MYIYVCIYTYYTILLALLLYLTRINGKCLKKFCYFMKNVLIFAFIYTSCSFLELIVRIFA